ncbi:hypothetical protein OROGR_030245 [Orobanche gracilis]
MLLFYDLFGHPIVTMRRLGKKKLENEARLKAELDSVEVAKAAEAATESNFIGFGGFIGFRGFSGLHRV